MRMRMRRLVLGCGSVCLFGLVFASLPAEAQATAPNEWTWKGGSTTLDTSGKVDVAYGTLGTPAAGNTPGRRASSATWTDKSGNLWLFSGEAFWGNNNDLWMFNPSTALWTWMGGNNPEVSGLTYGVGGVYGTLGTPSAGNIPGGRVGAVTWTDESDNFWMFGGFGLDSARESGYLNDLWEFDPSTNQWSWMGGSSTINCIEVGGNCIWGQTGVYGTQGVPAATNVPGGRLNAVSWIDTNGNLWMFGGKAFDASGTLGLLNDLWEFEPSTGKWTWVSGNSSINLITGQPGTTGQPGVYGVLGTPASTNAPGGRASAVNWADAKGNLWLFGGYGPDSLDATGYLNDLWEFDTSKSDWIWMGGSSTVGGNGGLPGAFATWMTPATGNYPGGRQSAASWIDSNGNFWLYGGVGVNSTGVSGELDDLWEFNPSENEWAWMGENSTIAHPNVANTLPDVYGQPGVYGVLQTPNFANNPGGLDSALGWTDKSGNFWLYGGNGFDSNGAEGDFNDLWEYQPRAAGLTVTATPSFSASTGSYAAGQTLAISDATPGATIYFFIAGSPAATEYTNPITISTTETVDAIALASGYATSAVATASYTVPTTAVPTFSLEPGTYPTSRTFTLADSTPGATIYYAINEAPTTASNLYGGPIAVSSSEIVEAFAVSSGNTNSSIATINYTIWPASTLNEWAWMGGLSTGAENPAYGALGTPDIENIPAARNQASSWTDKNGNFWLFGGNGTYGSLNDLWEFAPSTNEWAWMGGNIATNCTPNAAYLDIEVCSQSQPGVYGSQGNPAAENIPGGRYGASTWNDDSGNLWLFGGFGLDGNGTRGILNDLWKFNPTTGEWAWMGGGSTLGNNCFQHDLGGPTETNCALPSVYGTLGTPAAGDTPGSREDAITWTDSKGSLWLFGGWGYDITNHVQYYFDELWKFNPATGQWAWMGGSSTRDGSVCFQNVNSYIPTCGEPGTYGTIVTPSSGNIPGGRAGATGWADRSGNLWLFSGSGFDANGYFGDPNDLWEFNPTTNQWTWMGGNNAIPVCADYDCSPPGIQGTLGTPSAGNIPAGRDHASGWTDSKGNFWLYGGGGSQVTNNPNVYASDDLWEFNPLANEWAWMGYGGNKGAISSAVYGTLGTPAAGNGPGNRYGALGWTDSSGNLWLFGGETPFSSALVENDLWRYAPSAPAPVAGFAVVDLNDQAFNKVDSFTVSTGTSGTTTVNTVVAGGFDSPVTLSAVGLPSGITASFSPSSITGFGTSQVTFSIGQGVAPGNYTLTVAGTSSGVSESTTVSLTVASGSTVPASTPTFSVPAGVYASTQTVSISDATNGATIYYTTNGTTPTTGSTVYAGPIAVSSTETIEAIATASGYLTSAVASATYAINLPPPGFTVSGKATTVTPGATTSNTSTITVTPSGGFTGSVALTATVTSSPSGAQYPPTLSFGSTSPVAITGAGTGTAILTISTTAATNAAMAHPKHSGVPWYASSGVVLACILLFGVPARRGNWQSMFGVLALLIALVSGVSACGGGGAGGGGGGGGSGTPGTTAGSYTVTVLATSGAITETGTVALTVQ